MKIYFDKKSIHWFDNSMLNKSYLHYNMNYVKDILKYRGYIYLNQIYEMLGLKWNPERDNYCIRNTDVKITIKEDNERQEWVIDIK